MIEREYPNEGRDSDACRKASADLVAGWAGGLLVTVALIVVTFIACEAAGVSGDRMVEATASFFGVVGTLMLATRSRWAGYGFLAFLASNAGWLLFAHQHGHQWMFWQQVAFTVSSLVGVWCWLFKQAASSTVPEAAKRDCAAPTACCWPQCACSMKSSALRRAGGE